MTESSSTLISKLRPFVKICQINGLIPFSMEMDPFTGRFLKFTFSFKKFVSWWYIFLAIFQVSMTLGVGLVAAAKSIDIHKTEGKSQLPKTVFVLMLFTNLLSLIQFFMGRGILLRYKRLRKIIALIKEVEQYLIEEMPHNHYEKNKDSIITRTIFGTIFAISLIGFLDIASLPMMDYLIDTSNSWLVACMFVFQFFFMTIVMWPVLLLHLSHYIIAYLMGLLGTVISSNGNEIENMKKSRYIFGCLCKATMHINHIFSFPTLVTISSKLITIIYYSFSVIYQQLRTPSIFMDKTYLLNIAGLSLDIYIVMTYFTAADMPVIQARHLRENVIACSNKIRMQQDYLSELKIELMCFLMQMDEDRIRLSGLGLFQVGIHLVPTLMASIITYLVILLQTQ